MICLTRACFNESMLSTLAHWLIPQGSNNQRPKILQPAGLSFLVGIFLLMQNGLEFLMLTDGVKGFVLGYASSITPSQIVELTNQRRVAEGLASLTVSEELNQAAVGKANDMCTKQYWAHLAPDGTTPWVFIRNAGYSYTVAGENLARDFGESNSVVEAWMASSTHKANLIHPKYREIGVAVVDGKLNGVETTLVVQMFGDRGGVASSVTTETAEGETTNLIGTKVIPTPTPQVAAAVPASSPKPLFAASGSERAEATPAGMTTGLSAGTVMRRLSAGVEEVRAMIQPLLITKVVAVAIAALLILVLVVDAIAAYQRRTVRLVGRNLAHFGLLGVLLLIVLTISQGAIL